MVVMAEDAYFADPHVSMGLVAADGGVFTWPEVMGLHKVKELLLLGGRVTSDEALLLGLANRVVPGDTCFEVALGIAKKLASLPPQAVRETKFILNTPMRRRIEAEVDAAVDAESRSFDTEIFKSNLAAAVNR
jgi:enoyl-CoA hydratase